jgi:hypothetical protein
MLDLRGLFRISKRFVCHSLPRCPAVNGYGTIQDQQNTDAVVSAKKSSGNVGWMPLSRPDRENET